MAFVNPYTFIGFPEKVIRQKPPGHAPTRDQAKQRYTGSLTVTWTLKSPLAIPSDGSWGLGESDGSAAVPPVVTSGEIRIPGASVKGALRSAHEALFAGCARVIDPLFSPVYRDLMSPQLSKGWSLAVVVTQDAHVAPGEHGIRPDHGAVKVILCDGPVGWTRGTAVGDAAHSSAGRLPQTGDFIIPSQGATEHGRTTYMSAKDFQPAPRDAAWASTFSGAVKAGKSVILVTDTAARDPRPPANRYYWATAKPNPTQGFKLVTQEALRRFRQRLRGADRAPDGAGVFEDVVWPPKTATTPAGPAVARRRSVDGWLRQGDVVWVRIANDQVIDLKLSLGWRSLVSGPRPTAESRIPQSVLPCRHPAEGGLCLSCSIFGSIDATAQDEQRGAQDAYGAHVRIGDVTGTCRRARLGVQLAPLGTPHPGAGMYYLTPITPDEMKNSLIRPDLPSHWDSEAGESRGSRDLRGRKFYWHSDPTAQQQAKHLTQPRYERRPTIHTNAEVIPRVHVVEQADLRQVITFDGLDATALATLMATLTPSLVLPPKDTYALHLGRGKPLGLGSVQAEVALSMTTTADRYVADPTVYTELPGLDPTTRMLGAELCKNVRERCGDLRTIWAEAASVLDLGGLGAGAVDVSYPTLKQWGQFETDAFHESYAFFQQYSGQVKKQGDNLVREPWLPLPGITDSQGQG